MKGGEVAIVGGGIGGLAAAALLARDGYSISLFEKNDTLGGSCNQFKAEGFTFDTGPSFYLLPKVFENYFRLLDEKVEEHLSLTRLTPAQRFFWSGRESAVDFSSDFEKDVAVFDALEPGVSKSVRAFFDRAALRWQFAQKHMLHEPDKNLLQVAWNDAGEGFPDLGITYSLQREVSRVAQSSEVRDLLFEAAVFLGTEPSRTPALFSFLSQLTFEEGVWYPQGGMYAIVEALIKIGTKHGVRYRVSSPVKNIIVERGEARGLLLESGEKIEADIVVCNTDRTYAKRQLLERAPTLSERIAAPEAAFSAILLFVGVSKKVPELVHHNLFINPSWPEIFRSLKGEGLPEKPALYVCCPSKSDAQCAPEGAENLFVLIPVPASKKFSREELDACAERALATLEARAPIKENIIFQKRWYPEDFETQYHTFEGSALGLAHTFMQSGPMRNNHRDSTLSNLFFVGATSNPGIGVPTCLLSAEQVWRTIIKT